MTKQEKGVISEEFKKDIDIIQDIN